MQKAWLLCKKAVRSHPPISIPRWQSASSGELFYVVVIVIVIIYDVLAEFYFVVLSEFAERRTSEIHRETIVIRLVLLQLLQQNAISQTTNLVCVSFPKRATLQISSLIVINADFSV